MTHTHIGKTLELQNFPKSDTKISRGVMTAVADHSEIKDVGPAAIALFLSRLNATVAKDKSMRATPERLTRAGVKTSERGCIVMEKKGRARTWYSSAASQH